MRCLLNETVEHKEFQFSRPPIPCTEGGEATGKRLVADLSSRSLYNKSRLLDDRADYQEGMS